MNVPVRYGAISAVADICKPWIEAWGGDEWGDSMHHLHGACHTDYGFSDEDCALFASKLFENLMAQKKWMDEEGHLYGLNENDSEAAREAKRIRDYWLQGGNLSDWGSTKEDAQFVIDQMPDWMFDE